MEQENNDNDNEGGECKMEVGADEDVKPAVNGNNNDAADAVKKEECDEDSEMATALKKLGSEIYVTSKGPVTPKVELTDQVSIL